MHETPSPALPEPGAGPPQRWHLGVDGNCVGSGMCVAIAAGYFRLGEDERSQPVAAEIAPDDAVRDAAATCPMEAIVVTDAETGEQIAL